VSLWVMQRWLQGTFVTVWNKTPTWSTAFFRQLRSLPLNAKQDMHLSRYQTCLMECTVMRPWLCENTMLATTRLPTTIPCSCCSGGAHGQKSANWRGVLGAGGMLWRMLQASTTPSKNMRRDWSGPEVAAPPTSAPSWSESAKSINCLQKPLTKTS